MARNGASGYVMARMVLNVLIDVIIGAIPIVGDLFDFGFKANTRNMKLMHEHLKHGRHKGSATKVIIPVVLVLLIIFSAIVYSIYKLIAWVF
jgi:di/tricarboxylate transporter